MIRDFTTGKTKFVQLKIISPDGRAEKTLKGGIDKKTAKFESQKYDNTFICDIFDSRESLEDGKK